MFKKRAIFFIRSSAGELEWVLPIMNQMKAEGFLVSLYYLSVRGLNSCNLNSTCVEVLNHMAVESKLLFGTNLFLIQSYKILDVFYRASSKFGSLFVTDIFQIFIKNIFLYFLKLFKGLPRCEYAFLEYPHDKSLFAACLRGGIVSKKIFYFPHSPHISSPANRPIKAELFLEQFNSNIKEVYLLGSKEDISNLNKKLLTYRKSKVLIIGHPKLSKDWTSYLKSIFLSSFKKKGLTVAILSRGIGNFIDKDEQKYLCETTALALVNNLKVQKVFLKYHPREIVNTFWEEFNHHKFCKTTMSVAELLQNVDFIIGFWTSAALDSYVFGVPFIEFYRPDLCSIGQVKNKGNFKTIYEVSNLVHSAKDKTELIKIIDMATKGELNLTEGTFMLNDIFKASDKWWDTFKQAL